MPYAKYNPERFAHLEHQLKQILDLAPGETLQLACEGTYHCSRTRLLLYEWLHYNKLKSYYKIATEAPNLRIRRLGNLTPRALAQSNLLPQHLDEIMKELIRSSEDPMDILKIKLREKIITNEEVAELLVRYDKAMND